jgi:hypothetical protein
MLIVSMCFIMILSNLHIMYFGQRKRKHFKSGLPCQILSFLSTSVCHQMLTVFLILYSPPLGTIFWHGQFRFSGNPSWLTAEVSELVSGLMSFFSSTLNTKLMASPVFHRHSWPERSYGAVHGELTGLYLTPRSPTLPLPGALGQVISFLKNLSFLLYKIRILTIPIPRGCYED